MKVALASVGNIDFGQDPDKPMYGCEPNKMVQVNSFKEAQLACHRFIEDNDLGGGNWSGGQIYDDNDKLIGYVSYNRRVWETSNGKMDWDNLKEIKLEPVRKLNQSWITE